MRVESGGTYGVDLKVPWLARRVEVDDDLFVLQPELLDHNMGTVRPGTAMVGVESDLVCCATHLGDL